LANSCSFLRWDYLFSYIKKLKCHPDRIAPDRSHLTMLCPFMDAYCKKLIYTCHKRGTFAMGGMSATIPIKNDKAKHEAAMEDVRKDKLREVSAGHDGTWVAHPDLVKIARDIFDDHMKTPNQIHRVPTEGSNITQEQLLELPVVPAGTEITSKGLQSGVGIVLAYTEAWLRGVGCIPLHHKMEDAATAEISRVQIWQWKRHGKVTMDDGVVVSNERIRGLVSEEVGRRRAPLNEDQKRDAKWQLAGKLVTDMLTGDKLDEFLTSICYPHILTTAYEGSVVPDSKM